MKNYPADGLDQEKICAFKDREVNARRWPDPLPETSLLPGMKVPPMFVVWQHEKPHMVTDHSSVGINDGIPQAAAKVKYDDMQYFGQMLHDACEVNPWRRIITLKSGYIP
jgi:hypothetical protein